MTEKAHENQPEDNLELEMVAFEGSEKPANDNGVESKVLDDPDFQKLHAVAGHLEEIKDDETFKREAYKFADGFAKVLEDKNGYIHKAYKMMRKGWNKLGHGAQKAILLGEEHIPIAPSVATTLIEAGLLHYHGDPSPEARDNRLKESKEWNEKKEKWGTRIAAVFAPEIIEFMPVIELIQRFKSAKADVLEIIRHRLDAIHIEEETHGKEGKVMDKAA